MRMDLHVHTVASDGVLSVKELLEMAHTMHLNGIAITDHDTLEGLSAGREWAEKIGLICVPGVEISTKEVVSAHILGYGMQLQQDELQAFLEIYKADKYQRMEQILQKLQFIGLSITMEDLDAQDHNNLGRPHVARALVKKGYCASTKEAFDTYLVAGTAAYVPRKKANTTKAIQVLRNAGAIPVLAHPGLINIPRHKLLPLVEEWMVAGLQGIEVYHPAHDDETIAFWDDYARTHGMLVTGGSDFHETSPKDNKHGKLGSQVDRWPKHANDVKALLHRMNELAG